MTGREINFKTDKYNNPVYLSKRESVAQVIQNALFMKLGNNPSHPDRGVDIEQYLNKPVDMVDNMKILTDLRHTCGSDMVGNEIQSLSFDVVRLETGDEVALILIRLSIDNTEDMMAIVIQKRKDNVVRYNYNFINEDVPV